MMTSEQRLLQHQLLLQQQQYNIQQYQHQNDQQPEPMQQNLTSTVIDGAPAPAPNGPPALVPQAVISLQQQQSLMMMNPLMQLRPSAAQQQDDDDDKLSVHSHRSGKSAYSAYKTRSRDSLPALAEASPYGGGATRSRRPGSASKSTTTRIACRNKPI